MFLFKSYIRVHVALRSTPSFIFFPIIVQIHNAAEEPRALCIVQDTTNARTVNERLTLNLPASTSLSKLHQDVAQKAGYVPGTFELTWGNAPNTVGTLKPLLFRPAVLAALVQSRLLPRLGRTHQQPVETGAAERSEFERRVFGSS